MALNARVNDSYYYHVKAVNQGIKTEKGRKATIPKKTIHPMAGWSKKITLSERDFIGCSYPQVRYLHIPEIAPRTLSARKGKVSKCINV